MVLPSTLSRISACYLYQKLYTTNRTQSLNLLSLLESTKDFCISRPTRQTRKIPLRDQSFNTNWIIIWERESFFLCKSFGLRIFKGVRNGALIILKLGNGEQNNHNHNLKGYFRWLINNMKSFTRTNSFGNVHITVMILSKHRLVIKIGWSFHLRILIYWFYINCCVRLGYCVH